MTATTTTVTTTDVPEWKQELINLAKIDCNAARNEYLFPAPQALSDFLGVEPRDYPLWYNIFNCYVLTILNIALLPLLMDKPWYYMAALSAVRIALLGVPCFVLALHFSAHRAVIKPEWLNNLMIEFIIAPFFGVPPGVYRLHHVVMHHREDNVSPLDLSSTMCYQRDDFPSFVVYWLRFELAGWFELPSYLISKRYWAMTAQCLFSLAAAIGLNYYLFFYVRPAVALWLFLVPQVALSFFFMWGNFSQHILVDPEHYEDDHRLTTNLLATPFNQVAFNDGYHILHHKYPGLHWTELPQRFISERELKLHSENDAVCFKGIDWFVLGAHIFLGLWDRLVRDHFVPANQKQAELGHEERIRFLKKRLPRISITK